MGTLYDWSTTAASNGNADATINFAEGQLAPTLNNSSRAQMARHKAWAIQQGGVASGGSSNAYTYTSPSGHAFSALVTNSRLTFKANHTNTGAATLAVDGLTATAIRKQNGATALAAGDLVSGQIYDVVYDGTYWVLLTPSLGGAGPFLVAANNLSDLASASTARTNLGLGTAATQNTGTSGANLGFLNGTNTVSGVNTFTANPVIDRSAASAAGNLILRGGGTGFVRSSITMETGDTNRGAGLFFWDDTSDVEFFAGIRYNHSSADGFSILRKTSVTSGSVDTNTADPAAATELVRFTVSGIIARVATSTETSGTLTSASANRHLALTGNITLNNSVFTAGDKMTLDPGTSSRTITRGSGCTMYVNGVDSATATLAANQMGGVHVRSASVFVLSGAVS